jgi:hypothetical protein
MAVNKAMSYDHPAYLVPIFQGATAVAGASSVPIRFACFTAMVAKSLTVTPIIAGTGTGNCTVQVEKIASGGTAITTLAIATIGTTAAGITTNVALNTNANSTYAAGDVLRVTNGADATSVLAVGVELQLVKGASVTPDL